MKFLSLLTLITLSFNVYAYDTGNNLLIDCEANYEKGVEKTLQRFNVQVM